MTNQPPQRVSGIKSPDAYVPLSRPYVVAISAVGGCGKTALSRLVHDFLPASVLLAYDDFEELSVEPDDWYDWLQRGANIIEFDSPGFAQAVAEEVERGAADYLILDYPFGREHPRLRDLIDLSVFIDTPLDVALARRVLRDYPSHSESEAAGTLQELRGHLSHYLERARALFEHHRGHRLTSDLVLDGSLSLDELRDHVVAHLQLADRASQEQAR
jgi:uridine kinase